MQVIEVPRSLLQEFLKMPESDQVALYFLFGEGEDGADPGVYIGQSGDLRGRLATHNQKKDFWERALVLISRTNSLTQTHGLFLEWYSLQESRKAGRYANENGNSGSKPHTPAPLEADCLEIFDTGRTLLATLGYPVFDPISTPSASAHADEVFYCTVSGIDGRGLYTPEGFVVLRPEETGFSVSREDDGAYRVHGRVAERVVAMADLTNAEAIAYVHERFRRMGVERALERAGAREGDVVRIGDVELEYVEGFG